MNAMQVSNVVRCLSSVVFLVTCITSALTEAASYQKTDGTIVDPIWRRTNWDPYIHPYTGPNLEPSANLTLVSSRGIAGIPNALPTNWQLTHSISLPHRVLGNIRISRELFDHSWAASWFFE